MSEFDSILDHAAQEAGRRSAPRDGDYIGPDGLLVCGKCGVKKQCRVKIFGQERVVGCICQCRKYELKKEEQELKEQQMFLSQQRRRKDGIPDQLLKDASFETAQDSALIRRCRKYVENWGRMQDVNGGLLLLGGVGVGKTYAAACVCNALIERGYTARMTTLGRVLNAGFDEREKFLRRIPDYSLLVLDDLGVERESARGQGVAEEAVFSVVDERYRAGKPMIITTNLTLDELKNPGNAHKARVYDRVLEMCVPVNCGGESYRKGAAAEKLKQVREALR